MGHQGRLPLEEARTTATRKRAAQGPPRAYDPRRQNKKLMKARLSRASTPSRGTVTKPDPMSGGARGLAAAPAASA